MLKPEGQPGPHNARAALSPLAQSNSGSHSRISLTVNVSHLALVLLLSLWTASAYAHKPSDSYLALSVQGERVMGQWDIALRDLDFAIGLDADGNGEITWGEVKAKHNEIAAYAMARLAIAADRVTCPTEVTEH
jgi:hypothetical protein